MGCVECERAQELYTSLESGGYLMARMGAVTERFFDWRIIVKFAWNGTYHSGGVRYGHVRFNVRRIVIPALMTMLLVCGPFVSLNV